MSDKHLTILMPAAHAELARKLCAALWGQPEMFVAGLGATKDGTPTHWVSSGYLPEAMADVFTGKDAATLAKALEGAVPARDIQSMLDAAIVDDTGADPQGLIRELQVEPLDEVAAKTAEVTEQKRARYDLSAVKMLEPVAKIQAAEETREVSK